MAEPNPGVRPATEHDHEAAAEALALAFADDPAWAHLLPEAATRAERLLVFFTAEIGNLIPEHRQLWVTEDGSGAAIWAHPGQWRVPLTRTLRPARRMAAVFGHRLPLATWTQLRLERRHPSASEHWYLHYLGVEPRHQGRGLGGALLAPVLELCDREGIPAYLESSTERKPSPLRTQRVRPDRNLRDARRGANDPRDVARPDLGLFLAGLEPDQCQVSARLATSSRPSPPRRDE